MPTIKHRNDPVSIITITTGKHGHLEVGGRVEGGVLHDSGIAHNRALSNH